MSNDPWNQQSQDDESYPPTYPYTAMATSSGAQAMPIGAQAQAQQSYLTYSQAYDYRGTLASSQIPQPSYNYPVYGQDYTSYINQAQPLQYRTASAYLPQHGTVATTQPYASPSQQPLPSMSPLPSEHSAAYESESLPAEPLKDLRCYDHGCNGRAFSTHSNLLRHQREKSGKSLKYTCPNCQAQFTRNTAMKAHMDDNKCGKKRGSSSSQGQQSQYQSPTSQ